MNLRPRLFAHFVRPLFGHSSYSSRYAPPASGAAPDGPSRVARAFDKSYSTYNSGRALWLHRTYQVLAWLAGFGCAVVYLIWFFKNVFENTIR